MSKQLKLTSLFPKKSVDDKNPSSDGNCDKRTESNKIDIEQHTTAGKFSTLISHPPFFLFTHFTFWTSFKALSISRYSLFLCSPFNYKIKTKYEIRKM